MAMWTRLGLRRGLAGVKMPLGYWFHLSDEHLARVTAATGVGDGELRTMMLGRYCGTVLRTASPVGFSMAQTMNDWLRGQWVSRYRPSFCVQCLASDGAIRVSWFLPWTVVCLDHEVYMTYYCHQCSLPIDHSSLAFSVAKRTDRRNPQGGCECATRVSVRVRDQAMIELQKLVNDKALEADDERRLESQVWFEQLRIHVELLSRRGEFDFASGVDDEIRDAYRLWHRRFQRLSDQSRAQHRIAFRSHFGVMASLMRIVVLDKHFADPGGTGGEQPSAMFRFDCRVNSGGTIGVASQVIYLGPRHVGKMVTVQVWRDHYRIMDGPTEIKVTYRDPRGNMRAAAASVA